MTVAVTPDPAPSVEILAPSDGATFEHGSIALLKTFGDDDVLFKEIRFFRDGELVSVEPAPRGLPPLVTSATVFGIVAAPNERGQR